MGGAPGPGPAAAAAVTRPSTPCQWGSSRAGQAKALRPVLGAAQRMGGAPGPRLAAAAAITKSTWHTRLQRKMKQEEDTVLEVLEGIQVGHRGTFIDPHTSHMQCTPNHTGQVIYDAKIPFKITLAHIASSLGLNIYRCGMREEDQNFLEGFWDMDVPSKTSYGEKERLELFGDVRVRDVNREALDSTKMKLMAAEFWTELQEKATTIRKSYAETNKYIAMKNDLNEQCNEFADWLPIEHSVITEGAGKGNQLIYTYTGPAASCDCKDQFTIRLLQVLQAPRMVQDEPPLSPNFKNPLLNTFPTHNYKHHNDCSTYSIHMIEVKEQHLLSTVL